MITHITVTNEVSTIQFDVSPPSTTTRYRVNDIEGLGPVKADVNTSDLAHLDGGSFNNSRVGMRNIVIKFDYIPGYTASDSPTKLRSDLYAAAGPKKKVSLTFYVEGVGERKIDGWVESLTSELFSRELSGQLSIICPDPFFRGSLRSESHDIRTPVTVNYEGDVPTGFRLSFNASEDIKTFVLEKFLNSGEKLRLSATSNDTGIMPAGALIMISTVDRKKVAKTFSGTNLIPFMYNFNWWKLTPGDNSVAFWPYNYSGTYAASQFSITWDDLYGGL